MAIGDNYNDIEMLEFAGFPFVMANASEDLKQSGWAVTLDNEACGVAAAIQEVLAGALRCT
jgi:hydroxymethylpyrimidine pyrophosphatase-like HAD family hydrolase